MEEITLPPNTDTEQNRLMKHIFTKALGVPISLSAAPTTAGKELKANEVGFFGNDLYINLDGTIVKYTGTAT